MAIVAISPWLYVGFDTLPQAAEEFDFPPRRGRQLMLWSILAGGIMYVAVILATAADTEFTSFLPNLYIILTAIFLTGSEKSHDGYDCHNFGYNYDTNHCTRLKKRPGSGVTLLANGAVAMSV